MIYLLFACSTLPPFTEHSITLHNIKLQGNSLHLRIENGYIVDVMDTNSSLGIDYSGYWIAPAFIDSHVHLAYLPVAEQLLDGGVAAAVDLAAPLAFLSEDLHPLQMIHTGPMITAPLGYPTQSWGSNGYGATCADSACVRSTIESQYAQGARAVKLPLTAPPTLDDDQIREAVQTANNLGIPTIAHALSNEQANRAALLDIDVLAHTPTALCSSQTIALWANKHVISTLQAFGSSSAIENLNALHQQGTTILYGTDLGNTQQPQISLLELQKLSDAGLSNQEIIASGTSIPAQYWGFSDLGHIAIGYRASFVILDADPDLDISTLSRPVEVWINGTKRN